MKINAWKWVQVLVLSSAVVGCGDDVRPTPLTDAGLTDGGHDGGTVDLGHDAGRPDGGGVDTNNSFADAVPLTLGAAMGAMETIGVIEDKDYFSFDATAGDWIMVTTVANPDDINGMVDTVLTMYDSTMTQVAENDDAVPRISTDSEIIFHVVTTGTYYVEVQDFSDWDPASTPEAHPADTYEISVARVNLTAASVTVDPETGNDAPSATALRLGTSGGGLVLGMFDTATDVDVYSVTTASLQIFQATFAPAGPTGYGSTLAPRAAWVTDAAGTEIMARIPDLTISNEISPPLPAGSYLLWVDRPAGVVGANDFYVTKAVRGMENPPEAAEATNGVVTTPEVVPLTASTTSTDVRSGFVLAQLGTGDTDYFAIDVLAGEQVAGACGAETSGSGVRGLSVALFDSAGVAIAGATATENATDGGAVISATTVSGAGQYLFRLTKTGQDATVTGTWVRCGFRAITPTPAP